MLLIWFQSVNFFGCASSPREILGFDFSLHLIIPVIVNPEYPLRFIIFWAWEKGKICVFDKIGTYCVICRWGALPTNKDSQDPCWGRPFPKLLYSTARVRNASVLPALVDKHLPSRDGYKWVSQVLYQLHPLPYPAIPQSLPLKDHRKWIFSLMKE